MQQTITIHFYYQRQFIHFHQIQLTAQLTEQDGHSTTYAASRMLLNQLGPIDIRETSLNSKRFDNLINWEAYLANPITPVEELQFIRNPHFFIWNHYFCTAPLWELGIHSHYLIELQFDDLKLLPSYDLLPLDQNQELHRVILSKEHLIVERTFIFLNLKDFDDGRFSAPKLYIDTQGLFNGLYRRKQEEWIVYSIPKGEFPSQEMVEKSHGIIIPGSTSSAYDKKAWIGQLETFILDSYRMNPQIRILGICFGFQVISQAFGGKIEPTKMRRKHQHFNYYGNGTVILNDGLRNQKCFKDLKLKRQLSINRAHGDYVSEMPKDFMNGGHSSITQNEIIFSKDMRIMGMQCHPEYSSALLRLYGSELKAQEEKTHFHRVYGDEDFGNFFKQCGDTQGMLMCLHFLKY